MSLYNMLHGYEPTAGLVLRVLNVEPSAIPRFRDAYVTYRDNNTTDPNVALMMVILTRTGGGNRPDYEDENANLRLLPGYLDDADDEFDSTFALFRYALPENLIPLMRRYLTEMGAPLTLREKTFQVTGPDQTKRQKDASERVMRSLTEALGITKKAGT